VIILMIKSKGSESSYDLMEGSMKVFGLMESSMEEESSHLQLVKGKKGNGKTETD